MLQCPRCGKEVGEDFNYCPYCGSEMKVNLKSLELKVDDLRHDEKMSAIMLVPGFVLLIFGAWLGSLTATRIEWIGFIPHTVTYHPYVDLARVVLLLAIILIVVGGTSAAYYSYKRMKLMARLTK